MRLFPEPFSLPAGGVMNHEPSQNRGPLADSRRRRHRGSRAQEIIWVIPEGKWFGYRRRGPSHFSLAGGAFGGRFFLGRVRKSGDSARFLVQFHPIARIQRESGEISK